jgi:hypothetical protein
MNAELIQQQLTFRTEFWKKKLGWPNDNSSYVFLGRAVQAMGKSMFGDDWTGDEPSRDLMKELPVFPEKSGWRAYLVNDLLVKHHPEFNRQPRRRMQQSFEFTGKEWMTAVMIVKKHNEGQWPGVRRFIEVQDRIMKLAEAGLLITAIREKSGGDPKPISREWWNSERIRDRFDLCQLRPDDRYGLGIGSDPHQWIFVTRESLMSCAPETSPEKARSDVRGASPAVEAAVSGDHKFEEAEADKGGRPPDYDWEPVKHYALKLVELYGKPNRLNKRLPTKSQLVTAILDEWAKKDLHLAEPTVRRYVTKWLKGL